MSSAYYMLHEPADFAIDTTSTELVDTHQAEHDGSSNELSNELDQCCLNEFEEGDEDDNDVSVLEESTFVDDDDSDDDEDEVYEYDDDV